VKQEQPWKELGAFSYLSADSAPSLRLLIADEGFDDLQDYEKD